MNDDLRITLLGTGTPVPLVERMGCSVLVEGGNDRLIIDCGRGAAQRINQTNVPLKEIDTVFLTHLHYDHCVGIPDLWLTGWLYGRLCPVSVFGPSGTSDMVTNLARAFQVDVHVRRDLDEKFDPQGAIITGTDTQPGFVYQKGNITVESFAVDHHPVPGAVGYVVSYGGRKAVFSGDTRYMPSMASIAKNADLLVHEVAAPGAIWKRSESIGRDPVHTRAIIDHHATPEQVADIFSEARPRLAAFYHIVGGPGAEEEVFAATKKFYDGKFLIPDDLTTITIGDEVTIEAMGNETSSPKWLSS